MQGGWESGWRDLCPAVDLLNKHLSHSLRVSRAVFTHAQTSLLINSPGGLWPLKLSPLGASVSLSIKSKNRRS